MPKRVRTGGVSNPSVYSDAAPNARVAGAIPEGIQSNRVSTGAVEGDQIGDQLPGVLQSLQESPEATKVSSLYYREKTGFFNQPSFQRCFGAYNLNVGNIAAFGDTGMIEINKDIFWKGPMMLRFTVRIPHGYYGPIMYDKSGFANATADGDVENGAPVSVCASVNTRPRIFYSWGAGYAALNSIRCNMGGALMYQLDRYANWIGLMASCWTMGQRATLMKMAGGGVIYQRKPEDNSFSSAADGVSESAGQWGLVQNYTTIGDPITQPDAPLPLGVMSTVTDEWVVCVKTPHTSFSSPIQYRRPLDMKLMSTPMIFEIVTSDLSQFMDSGTGFFPLAATNVAGGTAQAEVPYTNSWNGLTGAGASAVSVGRRGLSQQSVLKPYYPSFTYRQLDPSVFTFTSSNDGAQFALSLHNFANQNTAGSQNVAANIAAYRGRTAVAPIWNAVQGSASAATAADALLTNGNARTEVGIQCSTVISDLRLANDMLGAEQVLRTDASKAIYYPFQHFVYQAYFLPQASGVFGPGINTISSTSGFGNITAKSFGNLTMVDSISSLPEWQVSINIPINPLTCLYMCVFREKDRASNGVGSAFNYSPCLFWNALELSTLQLQYSAQVLHRYDSEAEYVVAQLHERVEPLIVPYKGGAVTRDENLKEMGVKRGTLIMDDDPFMTQTTKYPGIWRTAHIYELCLVEQLPMRNEAFLQQTPSFRGEKLDLKFRIKPMLTPCDMLQDVPLMRDYSPYFNNARTDTTAVSINTLYAKDFINVPGSICNTDSTDNWNLNNDNLTVVCVYAQNAVWQQNPLFTKVVFARGA